MLSFLLGLLATKIMTMMIPISRNVQGCTEHCVILAICPSSHLSVIIRRNKEDAKKTSGSPGKPLLLTYSFSYDHNLPDSNSQKEALIKANYLLLLEEVTIKVNPLTSYVPVYRPHNQVQDFKAITHLLNSYLCISAHLFIWRIFPPTHSTFPILAFYQEDSFTYVSQWNLALPLWHCFCCNSLKHAMYCRHSAT